MQTTTTPSPLLTRREAAEYLRLSQRKVDQMIAEGELPRLKFGSTVRVERAALEAVIAAKKIA